MAGMNMNSRGTPGVAAVPVRAIRRSASAAQASVAAGASSALRPEGVAARRPGAKAQASSSTSGYSR